MISAVMTNCWCCNIYAHLLGARAQCVIPFVNTQKHEPGSKHPAAQMKYFSIFKSMHIKVLLKNIHQTYASLEYVILVFSGCVVFVFSKADCTVLDFLDSLHYSIYLSGTAPLPIFLLSFFRLVFRDHINLLRNIMFMANAFLKTEGTDITVAIK